jgi:CTP synthase
MLISNLKTDFHTTVEKALYEIDPDFDRYDGLIITGSHAPEDIDSKIQLIKYAREEKVPFLGVCMGMQLMMIEYARNVLGIKDATTEEVGSGTPIIVKMPQLRVGMKNVMGKMESHWHNYKFNPLYSFEFQKDWHLVYDTEIGKDIVLEIATLDPHPYFTGVQFHPEYQSSKQKPHPILLRFLQACKTNGNVDGLKPSVV